MDSKKLRNTLGLFSTGVIVACGRKKNFLSEKITKINQEKLLKNKLIKKALKDLFQEQYFGMTINSFSSVSMNPALVSFCVDNKSSNLNLFKKNRHFSLNILTCQQQTLASGFATPKNSNKWQIEPYHLGQTGSPIFDNSLAYIECKKHRIIKCGDHHIIIGQIVNFAKLQDQDPLVYFGSKFCEIQK